MTGAGGLSTTATSLTYTGDQVNAGTYYVTAHYAGDANHLPSDGQPVAITINAAALGVTATTQDALNIAKAGTISFALSNVTGLAANNNDLAALFTGADFTVSVDGTNYSATVDAAVVNGVVIVNIRMSAALQSALLSINSTTTKTPVTFSINGTSNDSNYTIDADAVSRLFVQGKLTY